MSLMVHFSIMSFSSPVSEPFPGTRGSRGYFHHHGTYRKLRNNLRRQRSRKLITLERFNSSFQERQSYLHIQRDIRLDKGIGSNSLIVPHHTHTYSRDHPNKGLNSLDIFPCSIPYTRKPNRSPYYFVDKP